MLHGLSTAIMQHKYIILNIVLVVGYLANTAILSSSYVQQDAQRRAQESLHSRATTVGKLNKSLQNATATRWIIVNLNDEDMLFARLLYRPLSFLDEVQGWSTILVGPTSRIKHGCSTCVEIVDDSPLLTAFVIAIKSGARQMYVMNSIHDVSKVVSRMEVSELRGLVYHGITPFKPCSHFAHPLFGTNRSFGDCFDRNWVYEYHLRDFPERLVISTCQECDRACPEIERGRIYCDSSTPNVAVQSGIFSQSTFENSLWTYDSFWALFIHILNDMSSSQSEALRFSYISQKLLWEINTSLAFVRSHDLNLQKFGGFQSKIRRNDVVLKACREKTTRRAVNELSMQLQKWMCESTLNIIECVNDLAGQLYSSRFLSVKQFNAIQQFINAIQSTSYSQPTRRKSQDKSINSYIRSKAKTVYFWPSPEKRTWSQNPFHDLCSNTSKTAFIQPPSLPSSSRFPFENILLVIVFRENNPATHIQMAQFFDYIYGHSFRHIIYCTTGTERIEMFAKMYPQPMSVIDLKTKESRLFPYLCVSEAMKMYQDVEGYLQIDSRILLNSWALERFSNRLSVPWLGQIPRKARLSQHDVRPPLSSDGKWPVWNDNIFGKTRLKESLEDLFFITKVIDNHLHVKDGSLDSKIQKYLVKYRTVVKQFLARFADTSLGTSWVYYGQSVVFFVPAQYRESFIIISEQCGRYTVDADLVVPTLLKTLDFKGRMVFLRGRSVRNSVTSRVTASFRSDSIYLFPWQMHMVRSPVRSKFMCQTYLPRLGHHAER